jgi:hypothetical protein
MARQYKTKRPMTLWSIPPRPPHAVTGKPIETRLTRDRQDATVQALEEAVIQNIRLGKGNGQRK